MVLTPSTTSGGIAGFTFWGMVWIAIGHVTDIGRLFHIPARFCDSKHIFRWVLEHKGLAILCSELINYGIHGVKSSTGVVFALGGTLANAFAIFGVLPLVNKIKGPGWLYGNFR